MIFLVIVFVSPLYFLVKKRWGGFVLNSFLYLLAVGFLVSIFGAWLAPFFWALAVGHAGWFARIDMMEKQAQLIWAKMPEQANPNAQTNMTTQ